MYNILLKYNLGFPWYQTNEVCVKGFAWNARNELLDKENLASFFLNTIDADDLVTKLVECNGQYSTILQKGNVLFAAVDRLRNFPLFYTLHKGTFYISDSVEELIKETRQKLINPAAHTSYLQSGYVIGRNTLIEGIYQIQAGEYICFVDGQINRQFYHQFINQSSTLSYNAKKKELRNILLKIGQRIVAFLNHRPAVIPLSGGFDSRLIAVLLKINGYENVNCFTYGVKGNPEENKARQVADRLGFPWFFVDYGTATSKDLPSDEGFEEYCAYSSNYTSTLFFQEYQAAEVVRSIFARDFVFLPGHSGDFLGGSHLMPGMRYYNSLFTALLIAEKHFSLIRCSLQSRKQILHLILNELKDMGNIPTYKKWENFVFRERQAKMIVNSAKIWDFLEYEYYLPLWDNDLIDFFAQTTFDDRLFKRLFNDVAIDLFSENGVYFGEDDIQPDANNKIRMQEIKDWIKCISNIKNRDIWKNDPMGFASYSDYFEAQVSNKDLLRNINQSNGLFTLWNMDWIEKRLSKKTFLK